MGESKNSIRSGLRRLFSSEVIVRSSDGENIKTADLNGNQAISQNMAGMYNGLYASGNTHSMGSGYGPQGQEYGFQASRINLFRSYEQMDSDPIISSALDVYANESSTKDAYGNIVDVKCENGEVKNVLENLLFDILNVNYNSRWWARSIAKYGDLFLHLTVNEDIGVTNVTPLSAYEVMRVENPEENTTQFYYDVNQNTSYGSQSGQTIFEEWEVAHFRFKNDGNFLPYGKSIIENGRKIWKQLSLMEEAMLIHRIMRAPEKRVFKIDVGNIEPDAIESHMNDVMNTIQQTPLIDPETGQYNLEFNMMNMLEDFFLPVRGNTSGTEIQSLQGLQYQAMEDVEYLRKKLMSALKVPNAFLGYEQEIQGKATLAQESIKFAQAVSTLQQTIARELKKIAVVHLYVRGYRGSDLIDFDFEFTNPSIVAEQERIEFLSRKIQLARDMKDLPFHSSKTIMKEIFNMSDEEIEENRKEKVRDYKREFRKEQITREGNDPIKTGRSYGTPADLAASGGSDLQHLDLDNLEDEMDVDDKDFSSDLEGVNNMKDLSQDIRPKGSDIKHKYQGGSPNALSASFKDSLRNRRRSLIQEATGKPEAILESIVKEDEEKNDDTEISDDSYMSESILNMSEETLEIVEEFVDKQKN